MAALTPTNDMIKREPARYKPWQKGMDVRHRIRWARVLCIFSRMGKGYAVSAFMARRSLGVLAKPSRLAALEWSIRTLLISAAGA